MRFDWPDDRRAAGMALAVEMRVFYAATAGRL